MLSEKSPPATCWFGGGSCGNCVCFKDPERFHELAQRSWNRDCDDTYVLLVRLIYHGWRRGAGVLVSVLSAGEKAGPSLRG